MWLPDNDTSTAYQTTERLAIHARKISARTIIQIPRHHDFRIAIDIKQCRWTGTNAHVSTPQPSRGVLTVISETSLSIFHQTLAIVTTVCI